MHPAIADFLKQKGVHPNYIERQNERVRIIGEMYMARPAKKATQALKLMEALSFVEPATEDRGQQLFKFVNLANRQAVCFDGVLAAGIDIEEDLNLCPEVETLKKALGKSGKSLTLTELPSGRLSVKGEKISVQVPCVATETLPQVAPDPAIAPISDEIKEAFKALEGIIAETGERVFETALLLEANVATATNGKVLMQYWHGVDLPPGLVLPRCFVKAVAHQFKSLKGFGWTPDRSVTFWFEDNSWYKTQVYNDKFPDIEAVINQPSSPSDIPTDLWEGCAQIAEFHENEWIKFGENKVEAGTAEYPVRGIQEGKMFDYKLMKRIIPFAKTADFTTYMDRAYFFGDKVRGVLVGIRGE